MEKKNEEIEGYKRRKYGHRVDLAGEHKFSDIGQLVLLIIFLILWILDSFVFKFSTFLVEYVPNYIRGILSSLVLIISGIVAYTAIKIVFHEKRDEPEVIRKSVFAIVRHPMYLGSILLYLGLFLSTLSLASLGLWIIIIIFYDFISSYEERLLIKNFGEDYENYKDEVGKWIPGLKFKKKRS